jgi:hypothetical protein
MQAAGTLDAPLHRHACSPITGGRRSVLADCIEPRVYGEPGLWSSAL